MNGTREQIHANCVMGLDTFGRPIKNDSETLPSGARVRRVNSVQKDCQDGIEHSNQAIYQTGKTHDL
jgi:hypothetical protein